MAEIYNFNNSGDEESESCCEYCDLAFEYMDYLAEVNSVEEVFGVLRDLIEESRKLAIQEHLQLRIESDTKLLDHLEFGCCGECDGECNCEDDE